MGDLWARRRVSHPKTVIDDDLDRLKLINDSDLTAILPPLYGLLPLPAASSALVEVLSESLFKFGKGAKILTEPLLAWFTGPQFQSALVEAEGGEYLAYRFWRYDMGIWSTCADSIDSSDEIVGLTKLLAALVEHSSEWFIKNIALPEVQSLLGLVLRLTGWEGTPSVDEQISEVNHWSSLSAVDLVQNTDWSSS